MRNEHPLKLKRTYACLIFVLPNLPDLPRPLDHESMMADAATGAVHVPLVPPFPKVGRSETTLG